MPLPKLCVTVTGSTVAELRNRRDRVVDADLVELRLDTVSDPCAAAALAGRRRPVIVTCRPRWEGGQFAGSEEARRQILVDALSLGAEFVDIEWRAGFDDVLQRTGGRRIVLSSHDFDGIPADLAARVHAMRATGAEVVKVAVMAKRLSDNLALLPLAKSEVPTALIAMGDAGLVSRVLAGRLGSCWTYAGSAVAPGQVPAERLHNEYGFRQIGPRTALYGVVGRPVTHSISPALHNAAFRANHLDAVYLPLAAATLDDFWTFADAFDVRGASVTAPFKVEAFERADESDAVSRRIRALNTLKRDGRRWIGCNTDVAGFLRPLDGVTLHGTRATILGAGGAARAVALALASAGALVTVCARRPGEAAAVAGLAGGTAGAWPVQPGTWDLLINATPAGTFPDLDDTPVAPGAFTGRLVYDLVYNPAETRLLRDAAAAGLATLGGLEMLVAQAQQQFEWWTGVRSSGRVMRDAALATLTTTADGARS
ncbi:MAG: shikimate dehydrogenase [Vicinamibacterales bacterium]